MKQSIFEIILSKGIYIYVYDIGCDLGSVFVVYQILMVGCFSNHPGENIWDDGSFNKANNKNSTFQGVPIEL